MNKIKLVIVIIVSLQLSISAANGREYRDERNVDAIISPSSGHLFDWSHTDRRIKTIMVDNSEVFTRNFLFVAEGCTSKQCSNSSILLVSSRPTAAIGQIGTLRVITQDRKGNLYTYTIKIQLKKQLPRDNETRFAFY
jgi:hypothetical protein